MHNTSQPSPVLIEREGEILSFTLNNLAHGNEINAAMFDAMLAVLQQEALTPSARVLRIRARGEVFCTGRERAGHDAASVHAEVSRLIEFKRMLRASPLITIAEVQGNAHGFGFGLAILCDFALVSSSAELAFPEMRKGLPPAAIMAYLGDYALPKAAFPLVLFGDAIAPEQALQFGLISEVCAPHALAARADALSTRVLQLDANGARNCKRFFQLAQENSLEQNFRLATEMLTVNTLRLMQSR